MDHPAVLDAQRSVKERVDTLLSINGERSVDSFHKELGHIMWEYCGMERSEEGLLKAIDLIRTESATFTMASTPFLTDLAKNVADSGKTVPTLATFLCAGAPIPGPLVEQARAVLGTKIVSAWGMTENGAVTLIKLDDDDERAFTTDGCPLPSINNAIHKAYTAARERRPSAAIGRAAREEGFPLTNFGDLRYTCLLYTSDAADE